MRNKLFHTEMMNTFRELVLAPNLSFLAPTTVDDLIRVGAHNDGGYVIPRSLISQIEYLISLGVNEDWSFDEQLIQLNPTIKIHAYDHTISKELFSKRLRMAIVKTCFGRSSVSEIRRRVHLLRSYERFFSGTVKHFQERIHNRQDYPNDATLRTVFERTNSTAVLLKMDIEGSEYRIIDDLLQFSPRLVGLVIEFHDTDPYRELFTAAVKRLKERFELIHLHANNCGGVSIDHVPEILELTFVKRGMCGRGVKRRNLPIPSVDSPSVPALPDYWIEFAVTEPE